MLIVRRSFPKIQQRLQGLRYLFTTTTLPELGKLEVHSCGELEAVRQNRTQVYIHGGRPWVNVTDWLEEEFKANNIPFYTHGNVTYFLFDTSSANLWVRTLVSVFDTLIAATKTQPTTLEEWESVLFSSIKLYHVAYLLQPFFAAILRARPFVTFLQGQLLTYYVPGGLYESPKVGADQANNHVDIDNKSEIFSDVGVEEGESPGGILLRYLQAVTAWHHAYFWLNGSKIFRAQKGAITLNIVKTIIPPYSSQGPIPSAMSLLEEYLTATKADAMTHLRVKEGLAVKDGPFMGTVHCEAILMALIGESTKKNTRLPSALIDILQDANKIMGVAKKFCWTCDKLAGLLAADNKEQKFVLPGTSGMIFPWAPPPGLKMPILLNIELSLKNLLDRFLAEHVAQSIGTVKSRQSSREPAFFYPELAVRKTLRGLIRPF